MCKGFRKQEMPEVYRPEADDDDELDDLIFEYTTRPSANLKEAIREIRGSKDRDAENYDSSTFVSASFTDRKSRLTIGNLS